MRDAVLNANVNAAWCMLSLWASIILGWKAYAFIKYEGLTVARFRFQLALALSMVCAGDMLNRSVVWLYWELRAHDMPAVWDESWTGVMLAGGAVAVAGMSIAIRALTYDAYGHWVWIAAMGAATICVLAF